MAIQLRLLHYTLFPLLLIAASVNANQRPGSLPLRNDSAAVRLASTDYGNLVHEIPSSVLFPTSVDDIVDLIKLSNHNDDHRRRGVAARGHGHSIRGQAMARGGVVVNMASLNRSCNGARIQVVRDKELGFYVDVGGEQLWIDVLQATLRQGLAPESWTDYLYLTVGGTLSNAGISGQAFLHGPQISNVLEMDVITGKGELMTCSKDKNPDLFFGVLGGLGQFGIITRARIPLAKAPTRVKWAFLVYSNFSDFSRDQEKLIASTMAPAPDFVEGLLVTTENITQQWRSRFSSPSNQSAIADLLKKQGILYAIEVVKYYHSHTPASPPTDKEFERLLKQLSFIPSFIFSRDASYFEFLTRVSNLGNLPAPIPFHPWLNLFIPKSRISDFNAAVLAGMLPTLPHPDPSTVYIFYPLNRNKWDARMSAVTPDEEVFYTLGLLHTSTTSDNAEINDKFNDEVMRICREEGIQVKQYFPHYQSRQEWINHFGPKWPIMKHKKAIFDPKRILSPGQRIFNHI
ncbi:cytokinin dehydrogenase 4-like [Andrographis paniculata]|uniref:cytokinin dehydrogenase 4-like n=1 Tax=Andrographis paniculata TaxID=175694 RepID=UPI0021E70DFA|nr:cytokinin dehydrogenase 4-like [Andrographis paniculata]